MSRNDTDIRRSFRCAKPSLKGVAIQNMFKHKIIAKPSKTKEPSESPTLTCDLTCKEKFSISKTGKMRAAPTSRPVLSLRLGTLIPFKSFRFDLDPPKAPPPPSRTPSPDLSRTTKNTPRSKTRVPFEPLCDELCFETALEALFGDSWQELADVLRE